LTQGIEIVSSTDNEELRPEVPEGGVPEGGVPEGAVPEGAVPEGGVPEGGVPEGAAPEGAVPEGAVPEGGVPEGAVPEGAVPEGGVPEGAVPEGGVPEDGVPEDGVPEGAVPEGGVPEGAVPEGGVPEGGVPEGAVPEGGVPEGGVPEDGVPEGAVPEGAVPEGAVKGSKSRAERNARLTARAPGARGVHRQAGESVAAARQRLRSSNGNENRTAIRRAATWCIAGLFATTLGMFFVFRLAKTEIELAAANSGIQSIQSWGRKRLIKSREPRAVPLLLEEIVGASIGRRAELASLIHSLARKEHRAAILLMLESPEAARRRSGLYVCHVLRKLPWLRRDNLHEVLARLLIEDSDERCRVIAALILASEPPLLARDALRRATGDRSDQVRMRALEALFEYRDPSLAPYYEFALKDPSAQVHRTAAYCLVRLGRPDAIELISKDYELNDHGRRLSVVESLQDIDRPEATLFLIRAIEDRSPDIGALAIRQLGRRRSKTINPALVRALRSGFADVRAAAAEWLGRRKVAEALPSLIKRLALCREQKEILVLDLALQSITGVQGIPIPNGSRASQKKTVAAWLAWYSKRRS